MDICRQFHRLMCETRSDEDLRRRFIIAAADFGDHLAQASALI